MRSTAQAPAQALMIEPSAVHLVADQPALEAMLTALAARAGQIGIDTEFMRTSTYFPQLCLLQIAADDTVYCIDPLSVRDLRACYEFLADPARAKTMHAARQDLEVLNGAGRYRFQPLFDTQIAAALTGHPDQVSYAALAERHCGVVLDKSQTRTDWAQRPLTVEQLTYAARDVLYLAGIRAALCARLEAGGKLAWLEEECARLTETAALELAPGEAWRRLKGLGQLAPGNFGVATALAAWREEEARRADRPRAWILRDEALLAIARQAPATTAALAAIDGVPPATVRRHAASLLARIADALEAPLEPPPVVSLRLTAAGQSLVGELQALVQTRAAAVEVVPTLIASRRDLELAVMGERGLRFEQGWRHALAGAEIAARIEAAAGAALAAPR